MRSSLLVLAICLILPASCLGATILEFTFETPNGNVVIDSTGNYDGEIQVRFDGSAEYEANTPSGIESTQSIRLTETGTGATRIVQESLTTSVLDFSNHDWTFAAWFNRADSDNDDYILHLGEGYGHGDENRDELGLYAHGADSITLEHYNDTDPTSAPPDVSITATGITPGTWHHVAIVHNNGGGLLQLYLDGILAGEDSDFSLEIDQAYPFVIGGHEHFISELQRWFDGNIDDVTLWDTAMSSSEIRSLVPVPEPGAPLLIALGVGGLLLLCRRKLAPFR